MNDIIRSVILGIIEGLTEFLPISSTGHMILASPALEIDLEEPFWKSYIYFIQVGAILAVVIYFWPRLWKLTVHPPDKPLHQHLLVKLGVAFMPAAVFGLLLNDVLEEHLEHAVPVAVALIVGAALIELIERKYDRPVTLRTEEMTLKQALLIGCAQCLAMIPGTSRSGATIMGGLVVGLSAPAAAEFSFFLAIPTICAAGGYSLFKHREALTADNAVVLTVGFVVSFAVAYVVVASFMRYIQTHKFRPFVIYRVLLGITVLTWYWWPRGGGQ